MNYDARIGDKFLSVRVQIDITGSHTGSDELLRETQERILAFLAKNQRIMYAVYLDSAGPNKIQAIKTLRDMIPEFGLKEAKDMVESAPTMIVENIPKPLALQIAKHINDIGGRATAAPPSFMVMK